MSTSYVLGEFVCMCTYIGMVCMAQFVCIAIVVEQSLCVAK